MRKDIYDSAGEIVMIPAEMIRTGSLRRRSGRDLEELTASIAANGLLEPISVRQEEDDVFRIIAGERRYYACTAAGMRLIPCILIGGDTKNCAIYALIHHQTRRELHYLDQARLLRDLLCRFGLSVPELSERTGLSTAKIKEKLKLMALPEGEQAFLRDNGIAEDIAALAVEVPEENREDFLAQTAENEWNLMQARAYAQAVCHISVRSSRKIMIFKNLTVFTNTIDRAIDTMKNAGIRAEAEKQETESEITYTVTIQKTG